MHEMSYVVKIVNQALEAVEKEQSGRAEEMKTGAGAAAACAGEAKSGRRILKVQRVVVEVGEMTGILPAYLCKYYSEVIAGTLLEGSELDVQVIPVKIRCKSCGEVYHPDREHHYSCPGCGSSAGGILSGRGLRMREVVVKEV